MPSSPPIKETWLPPHRHPTPPRVALTWLGAAVGSGSLRAGDSGSGSGGRRVPHWPPALRWAGPGGATGARAAPPRPKAAAAGRWDPEVGAGMRGVGRRQGKRTARELAEQTGGRRCRGEAGRGERRGEARGRGAPQRGAEWRGLGALHTGSPCAGCAEL